MWEKIFKLKENGTTSKKEFMAGAITFLTMSYILIVNPNILGQTGMDRNALFTATALASIFGTLLMAFLAKIPIAQAPGMGLNNFFATTVVLTMGYSWQFALTAVFIEGIIFILLTFFNIRELIVNSIPQTLKNAIPAGIGLFITLLGLQHAGLVVKNEYTMITLGSFEDPGVWVAVFGLIITGVLLIRNIHGAILIGILAGTLLALITGVTRLPENNWISLPPDIRPIFAQFEWDHILSLDMVIVVFTFLFVNLFDTVGTLIGVASKAGLISETGHFPQVKKALFADALGTTFGALLGTSTVTSYVESASGVAAGGRTRLTAASTAFFFFLALFLAPLFLTVPGQATAPALIIVGLFMISSVVKINFNDYSESIPAFLTIIMMPFTLSIAQGIIFGMLGFVLLKLFSGKQKDITLPVYVIGALFLLKILLDVFHVIN